jgi:hypothetical protein
MSGRKQHIVPKFLQQGFSTNEQTFVYTKEKIYSSNIKDVLAERDFYSSPEDTTIDDKITNRESLYFSVVNNLLKLPTDTYYTIDNDLKETIIHFIFRAKYVRTKIITNLIDMINHTFNDEFKDIFFNKIMEIAKPECYTIIKNMIQAVEIFPIQCQEQFKTSFKNKLNNLIVDSDKLSQSDILEDCYYQIIQTEENLILPDCFVTCLLTTGEFTPFPEDAFNYIYFPIYNDKLLVISKEQNDLPLPLDITQLKIELAKSANERFISKTKNESFLQSNIGQNQFLLFIDDMKEQIKLSQESIAQNMVIQFFNQNNHYPIFL